MSHPLERSHRSVHSPCSNSSWTRITLSVVHPLPALSFVVGPRLVGPILSTALSGRASPRLSATVIPLVVPAQVSLPAASTAPVETPRDRSDGSDRTDAELPNRQVWAPAACPSSSRQSGRHAQAADEASTLSRQCLSQSRVNFLRGLFLHAGHHMAVRVQGNIDGGVTEALADSFGSGHTSTADLLEVYVTRLSLDCAAQRASAVSVQVPVGSGEQGDGVATDPGGNGVTEIGKERALLQAAGNRGREQSLGGALALLGLAAQGEFAEDDRAPQATPGMVVGGLDAGHGGERPEGRPALEQVLGERPISSRLGAPLRRLLKQRPQLVFSVGWPVRAGAHGRRLADSSPKP